LGGGMFEEAINLCTACTNKDLLAGIDLVRLFESSANTLMGKGDFEKAVQRFIMAKTDFIEIARNFPDFIPVPLQTAFNIVQVSLYYITCFQLNYIYVMLLYVFID
jgi:hypothetical protein